jgi:hypothetical protein
VLRISKSIVLEISSKQACDSSIEGRLAGHRSVTTLKTEYESLSARPNSAALLMPIFAPVFLALEGASLPFLVIGGHAVILHGHLRSTFDLDLLIADSKLDATRRVLTDLGYRTFFETDAFLQLQAPENLPPLDLMIVDDQTFGRIDVTAQ